MKKLIRLITISRPIFCLTISSIYFGGWLISNTGWSTYNWLYLFFCLFPMGIIVFGVNDISDIDSDSLNVRKGDVEGAVLKRSETDFVKASVWIAATTFLVFSLIARRWPAAAAVVGVIVFAVTYSLKPIRLKSVPMADSISNGLWVLFVFLLGYYANDQSFASSPPWNLMLLVVLTVAAIHSLTTLFDLDVDLRAGDKTIGTTLGLRRTITFALVLFASGFIFARPANIFVYAYYSTCCAICIYLLMRPSEKSIHNLTFATIILAPMVAGSLVIYGF